MVRPCRVVSGLSATPKRSSAGLEIASCRKRESEVRSPKSEVRICRTSKARVSALGFAEGEFRLTVSVFGIITGNSNPYSATMGMDGSQIGMKESRFPILAGRNALEGFELAEKWNWSW